ncbi:MAG: hypothetical protein AB3N26_11465, partial [Vibrio tubiashii]
MLRILFSILLVIFSLSTHAVALDQFRILNHLDNYGNLDLRNKPYTELPSGLVIKGNLNIAKTSIKRIPKGVDIQGSLT